MGQGKGDLREVSLASLKATEWGTCRELPHGVRRQLTDMDRHANSNWWETNSWMSLLFSIVTVSSRRCVYEDGLQMTFQTFCFEELVVESETFVAEVLWKRFVKTENVCIFRIVEFFFI